MTFLFSKYTSLHCTQLLWTSCPNIWYLVHFCLANQVRFKLFFFLIDFNSSKVFIPFLGFIFLLINFILYFQFYFSQYLTIFLLFICSHVEYFPVIAFSVCFPSYLCCFYIVTNLVFVFCMLFLYSTNNIYIFIKVSFAAIILFNICQLFFINMVTLDIDLVVIVNNYTIILSKMK